MARQGLREPEAEFETLTSRSRVHINAIRDPGPLWSPITLVASTLFLFAAAKISFFPIGPAEGWAWYLGPALGLILLYALLLAVLRCGTYLYDRVSGGPGALDDLTALPEDDRVAVKAHPTQFRAFAREIDDATPQRARVRCVVFPRDWQLLVLAGAAISFTEPSEPTLITILGYCSFALAVPLLAFGLIMSVVVELNGQTLTVTGPRTVSDLLRRKTHTSQHDLASLFKIDINWVAGEVTLYLPESGVITLPLSGMWRPNAFCAALLAALRTAPAPPPAPRCTPPDSRAGAAPPDPA